MLLLPTVTVLLVTVSGSLAFSLPHFSWLSNLFEETKPLWDDLRVTFSPLGKLNGFHRQPRTAAEAREAGFTMPPEETATDIEVLCPNQDPSVCIVFDKQGSVAGIELGVQRSDVDNKGYPYDQHLMFVPKTRFGYEVYVTTLFFVPQSVLAAGGRKAVNSTGGTGTGLWLQNGGTRDNLFEIPRHEKDIGKTAYTKENCVPGMGRHYYYNISESMQCEDFFPIFALYEEQELIGFGYQTYGKITKISQTFYESIPTFAIRPTIPNAPQCLIDRANEYGVVSLHVYFVDTPWDIGCTLSA